MNLGVGPCGPFPIHAGVSAGLVMRRFWFAVIATLSSRVQHPGRTGKNSFAAVPSHLWIFRYVCSFFQNTLCLGVKGVQMVQLTCERPYFFGQPWVFMSISAYCKKKILWQRLRVALIYGHKIGCLGCSLIPCPVRSMIAGSYPLESITHSVRGSWAS